MKKLFIPVFLCVLILVVASCNLMKTITGEDQNTNQVSQLWSDVPPMDGLQKSQSEMPFWLRLIVRNALSVMMRGVNDGKDAGEWDVIFFTAANKTTRDVADFYTTERMRKFGWEQKGDSNCANLSGDKAILCFFVKHTDNKVIGLGIIAANDEKTKEASLFFFRQETAEQTNANKK